MSTKGRRRPPKVADERHSPELSTSRRPSEALAGITAIGAFIAAVAKFWCTTG